MAKIAIAAIVAGVVAVALFGGLDLGRWLDPDNLKARAGTSTGLPDGYQRLRFPDAEEKTSVVVGAPWGMPCRPVVVALDDQVPAEMVKQTKRVVREARQAGLDVAAATAEQLDTKLAKAGDDAAVVRVKAKDDEPATMPNGASLAYQVKAEATPAEDPELHHLSKVTAKVYLRTIDGDAALLRASLRAIIASGEGLDPSADGVDSGLTLRAEDAADGFSPADVAALLAMSGCAG